MPASVDMVLWEGDSIRTHAGANLILQLSDGTQLIVAENTNISIAKLAEDPQTGARTSRLILLWGKMRSLVSAGHQAKGSSYTIETPNAFTDIQFSQPDSEVLYDPGTSTTTVMPHKFDVIVTNRVTNDTVRIPEGFIGIIQEREIQKLARTIPFTTGSMEIDPVAQYRLHSLAMILREFPDQVIILEGHTDSVGPDKTNQRLGQERAEAVKTYLVQKEGFDPDRIKTISYGAEQPLASNDTEIGRSRNRRVTVSRDL
ncbi:OmpA/MotB domain protein [Candidatus Vecturithrix granuli]|uniref:OmpA/MotB domain protein n=1 Tax=Vecturithrix granuli TaxID=1499967 RepID=A0A081BXJ4_VECG1|nr:OmpA/MotB domain protein [Candidatus Vecturithrix granuli]